MGNAYRVTYNERYTNEWGYDDVRECTAYVSDEPITTVEPAPDKQVNICSNEEIKTFNKEIEEFSNTKFGKFTKGFCGVILGACAIINSITELSR